MNFHEVLHLGVCKLVVDPFWFVRSADSLGQCPVENILELFSIWKQRGFMETNFLVIVTVIHRDGNSIPDTKAWKWTSCSFQYRGQLTWLPYTYRHPTGNVTFPSKMACCDSLSSTMHCVCSFPANWGRTSLMFLTVLNNHYQNNEPDSGRGWSVVCSSVAVFHPYHLLSFIQGPIWLSAMH